MKKILLLLLLNFLIAGCATVADINDSVQMDYSYLALGDSYTIGEGVEEDERWPVQLVEELRERGFKVAPPKIVARTGWTTGDLIREMDRELNVHRDFDIVSVLIGVNNQYQDRPKTEFEEELRQVFRKAINHCKRRERGVFALSIPDYSVTPFGAENDEEISREINEFNEVYRRVAEEFEIDFYNITPITREAAREPDLTGSDGLHPSPMMYRFWVEEIINEVAEKLPEK